MPLIRNKRIMRRRFIFVTLFVLALVSCQHDLEEISSKVSGVVFTATTEGSDTRTALSENEGRYNVVWRSGDRITIADGSVTPNVGEYSTTSETTSATFTKESGADPAATPYKAWYPATLYNAGAPTLPATQDYVAGNISGMPMYAESSTTDLSFKNLCGIIRLNVSTTISGKKVRRIILAADQGMSGAISNAGSLEGSGYAAAVFGTVGVTLDCGEGGVAISGSATPFHIAVPANTYTTLKITVVTTDGEVQTRTSNKGIAVERSKITDITLGFGSLAATTGRAAITGGGSQEWVQLWAGGPKWAKFNVGSTITSYADVTEYNNTNVGGHYSYRGRYDNTPDAGGTDDTAKYQWGENWTTPSSAQEQALLDNCIWSYCDGSTVQYEPGCTLAGYKVSGKDAGYTENSIFLPYAGINDQNTHGVSVAGTRGVYWSIDAGGSGAYYLNEGQYGESVMSHNQPHGCSVRAICTYSPNKSVSVENELTQAFMAEEDYDGSDYSYTHMERYQEIDVDYRKDWPKAISIDWDEDDSERANYVIVKEGSKRSYCLPLPQNSTSYDLYNLIPNQEYEIQVVEDSEGQNLICTRHITPEGQVRMIRVDGNNVGNVRDLGGWKTKKNGHIKYGRLFRSAELSIDDPQEERISISEKGIATLRSELNIDVEIDFGDYSNDSPLEEAGIEFVHGADYQILPYSTGFAYLSNRQQYANCLRLIIARLSEGKNILFHCNAGADRTGTLAFLIEGLVGVSESDLAKDYELTSFSVLGHSRLRNQEKYSGFIDLLNGYEGDNINDKIWSLCTRPINMRGLGLSESEIKELKDMLVEYD